MTMNMKNGKKKDVSKNGQMFKVSFRIVETINTTKKQNWLQRFLKKPPIPIRQTRSRFISATLNEDEKNFFLEIYRSQTKMATVLKLFKDIIATAEWQVEEVIPTKPFITNSIERN